MSDPKPRKPAARKTTRPRSDPKTGTEVATSTGASSDGAAPASTPRSNDLRSTEEPLLAIEQVAGADASSVGQTDSSYASAAADGTGDLDGEIRRRAYELYLARGGAEGNDLQDWLDAERLVRSRRAEAEQGAQDLPPTE